MMARRAGHTVSPMIPALTAIEVREDLRELRGVRVKSAVSLFESGDLVYREEGQIQFREDCVSGICIMNMSSHLPVSKTGEEKDALADCRITVNFVPDFKSPELIGFLRQQTGRQEALAEDILETLVKGPLIRPILLRAGIEPNAAAGGLSSSDIMNIANALRMFELTPLRRKGWKEAQVTKGGVDLKEIDEQTMESKIVPGLYFAGEVTDYDGPCGGYNLNNAWITGIKAGTAMAERIKKHVQNTSDKIESGRR